MIDRFDMNQKIYLVGVDFGNNTIKYRLVKGDGAYVRDKVRELAIEIWYDHYDYQYLRDIEDIMFDEKVDEAEAYAIKEEEILSHCSIRINEWNPIIDGTDIECYEFRLGKNELTQYIRNTGIQKLLQ